LLYFSIYLVQGLALVTTVFIVHGVVADVLGSPCDFTYPLAYVAHTLTLVPMPGVSVYLAKKAPAAGSSSSRVTTPSKADTKKAR
jgi:hypothetical protein